MNIRQIPYVWLTLFLLSLPAISVAASPAPYQLREGDALLVSVWGETALNKEVRVLPDGSITFPLAGRIEVAGLTTPEVEKNIAQKLKTYLPEPQVTVVVTATEGSRAYILGKVLKPGPIPLVSPTTVMQALSMAGGLDKFADLDAVKIIRVGNDGTQSLISVMYASLLKGESLESNVVLLPGDTIVVP